MPKAKRTRRGGVKHCARRLLAQFTTKPANPFTAGFFDIEYRSDAEYEALFQNSNSDFDRREGYNSKVPWPFTLLPFAKSVSPVISETEFHSADPRRAIYSTPRKYSQLKCDYCNAYL